MPAVDYMLMIAILLLIALVCISQGLLGGLAIAALLYTVRYNRI
jgi:hypothetical protein